jgi:hypothetical protein
LVQCCLTVYLGHNYCMVGSFFTFDHQLS